MKTGLTEAEAGKHLKISRAKLVDLRKNHGLPHIRIGSAIRYDAEKLDFFLERTMSPKTCRNTNEQGE